MTDREKVVTALECLADGQTCACCDYKPYDDCSRRVARDAIALLKEQKVRELTIDEWREWKANPKRNPICELWENDTSPMWILNSNDVHEPALLMGKLRLFTGKPTFEQCKEVKWNA